MGTSQFQDPQMSFFSPLAKAFTLMCEPPHPNLLWELPESALANECLPDHQNNTMFIPEAPSGSLCEEANRCLERERINVCLEGAFSPNREIFADLEIHGREGSISNSSSAEIQRKFREVDLWLEEQSKNSALAGPSIDQCRESHGYNGGANSIPHHLLVQMGLADGKTATSRSGPSMESYIVCNNGTYFQDRGFEEEPHVLPEQGFESVDVNMKMQSESCGGGHYDNREGYNEESHENPREITIAEKCEESVSSLSQLFHDEEFNEEDMREIDQSMKTINRSVANKGHLLDGKPGNSTTSNLPETHRENSSYQCKTGSSVNLKRMADKGLPQQREASNGTGISSNNAENATLNVEKMLDDLEVSQTSLSKQRAPPEVLDIPQFSLVKSIPVAEILISPLKSSSQLVEVQTPPLRSIPKILETIGTPLKPDPSPAIVEIEQRSTPKVVELINALPTPSPNTTETISTPPSISLTPKTGQCLPCSQLKSRSAAEMTPKCPVILDLLPDTGVTHQNLIASPEVFGIPKETTMLTPDFGKISPTAVLTLSQTTPKNEETIYEKPEHSSNFRDSPHDSPENPKSSHGAVEISATHHDYSCTNVVPVNKDNDVAVGQQDLPTQSSLSQLFHTQEFTVGQYMDMVRCNFQGKAHKTADSVTLMDEVTSPTPGGDTSTQTLANAMKMNSQPFVIRGNEPKLFDISVEREEDRPWKEQVTEGVLEPSNEVFWSRRDQKFVEEIPMVVSPYFPNLDNHPVQDGRRTTSSDSPKLSGSKVLNLSQESSTQDVLGKILNYERATDDHQICKDFFSQRSPPQTPNYLSKDNNSIFSQRKRGNSDNQGGTSKTKKPRMPKKHKVDNQKITDYFSVVKQGGKHGLKTKGRQTKVIEEPGSKHTDHSQHIERASSKFKFEELPSGSQMKMANFHVPHSNSVDNINFATSAQKHQTTIDLAPPTSSDLDKNVQPKTNVSLNQLLAQNSPLSHEQPSEAISQAPIEFNCFPRQCRMNDEDCEVILMEEEKVEEVALAMERSGDLVEIGFTICYRQKYSRLNMPDDGGTLHSPCGIMSRVEFADCQPLFIYQDMNGLEKENSRSFILCLLESKCRKVCFEAQAFIMFILDALREQDLRSPWVLLQCGVFMSKEVYRRQTGVYGDMFPYANVGSTIVCYDWHLLDPMIGMWLMDPDHPPQNFLLLLNELELKVVKIEVEDWKLTVSRYLSIQSLAVEKLYDKLTELGLWDVFSRMETTITPILAAMELRNIEVNYSRLRETSKVLQKKISAIEHDAWKIVGKKFQMSSPVQLRRILYEELKLDEIGSVNVKTTATSKAKSTDEGTLKSLAGLHPLPRLILEYRHAHKIKTTYTDGLLAHVVNKRTMSTTWEQCAAATGRITSSNPNMQSIPKRDEDMMIDGENFNVRKVFTARPGRKFIAVDFQQIELRTFAHLSEDEQLMSVFRQPGDIFVAMTKMRLGTDDFDATEREKTKTLMYALLYGAGVHKISQVLSVDAETANRVCGDFYRLFPGLKNYRFSVLKECRTHKTLRSLSGRRRLFPLVTASCIKQKRYTERQAVNFTIQGSAADICKAAMLRTELALRDSGFDASLLLQIHDELLWEVPEDLESQVKDTIRKSIEETSDYWTKKFNLNVPMPVKITTGSSWGSMN